MIKQKSLLIVISIIVVAFNILGCTGKRQMAISSDSKYLNTDSESIALLVVRTRNNVNKAYLPEIYSIEVLNSDTKKIIKFDCVNSILHFTGAYIDHLISFQLSPGVYAIKKIRGVALLNRNQALSILVAPARFSWEINGLFDLNPEEIIYLGHLELTNRNRINEDEKVSGPLTPYPSLNASGFSKGTFDVTLDNRKEEDMEILTKHYQWIKKYSIKTSILQLLNDKYTN